MNYRKHIIYQVLLSTAIFATLSCNIGNTVGSHENGDSSSSLFDTPFPCAEGMEWSYRFTDTDMKLVATDTTNHATVGEVSIIEKRFRSDNDRDWYLNGYEYLQVTEDEIRRYDDLISDSYSVLFELPLELGDTWRYRPIDHPNWIATVVSIDNVITPSGTYTGCYRVEYYSEDSYWGDTLSTTWYAPGIGGLYGVREEDGKVTELVGYEFPDEQALTVAKSN